MVVDFDHHFNRYIIPNLPMSLDQTTAEFRAKLIRKGLTSYNFNIVIAHDHYQGIAELSFYLEHLNFTQLPIDFTGALLEDVIVNSKKLKPRRSENFIYVPVAHLQRGRNKMSVLYRNNYDKDRRGCMTFDVEGEQYVYTKFEPYGCHKVFPCFDQPDIKARMKIAIVSHPEWTIASNQPTKTVHNFNQELYRHNAQFSHEHSSQLQKKFMSRIEASTKMTFFDYTEEISTYLYVFVAGPFAWIDSPEGSGTVPMRIYSVKPSLQLLDGYSSFIFDVVQKAMAFFQSFFAEKYPFVKYDQIFVRNFQSSAMENAALVAFRQERFLLNYSTEDDYFYFASVMVHQLSHHWFGNLVTMKWWDDLWLNQSFADFIADFCLSKINDTLIHPLQPSGMYFRNRKIWGYDQDERNSATHPIRAVVQDTDVAVSIFDGITYAKGAGTLKQLMFLVGQSNFAKGVQKYMDQFRWSNATILDLLEDLTPYFPPQVAVAEWRDSWLESPSLNVIGSIWDLSDQTASTKLKLYQSAFTNQYSTLRWHKFEVAFFNSNADVVQVQTVMMPPSSQMMEITYDGTKGVKAIFVNFNDEDFVENYMDQQSISFFMQNIDKVKDELNRSLIWFNLSQLVKQSILKLEDYVQLIKDKLLDQPQTFVIKQLLTVLSGYINNYLEGDDLNNQIAIIFDAIYKKLQDVTVTDKDRLEVLYKMFVKYAQSDQQILKLKDWVMGDDPTLATREIFDKNLPWEIVKKIFSVGDASLSKAQKQVVFDYVMDKDTEGAERAATARYICDIIICSKQQFDQIYQRFRQPDDDLTIRNLLLQGWRNRYHQDWVDSYKDRYFADIVPLSTTLPYAFFQFFYQNLKPMDSDWQYQIQKYNEAIEELRKDPNLTAHVVSLSKMKDDLQIYVNNSIYNNQSNSTLTQERAVKRFSYINSTNITYAIHIAFSSLQENKGETFDGMCEITFTLTQTPSSLPLDFSFQTLHDFVVNGQHFLPPAQGQFVMIPRVYLKVGVNHITARYTNKFSNDGYGCVSFVDTTVSPSQFYAYTHFQPYSAHKLFPCFDQPDLKALMNMNVILPTGWKSVSNGAVKNQSAYTQGNYIAQATSPTETQVLNDYLQGRSGYYYIFNQTKKLPTYLYCLVAGQYVSVTLDTNRRLRNIEMSVYSLASYKSSLQANAQFIFEITKLAITFFQSKFNVAYPFSKYDTVFCHQYPIGAMENPGVVTFNDAKFLFNQTVSEEQMLYFAEVICHECSHSWFGDLVTMKWFDDTWLKESFADFMAFSCLDDLKNKVTTIPQYTSGWLGCLKRAVGGYREDQLSTTHPVRSVVPNTNLAKMYFDGITYRKGMMTLKQLSFLMGSANFFKGVTDYFNKFPFGNGTIDDFLTCVSPYYANPDPNYTLEVWKQMWLLTSSLNVLTSEWDPLSTSPTSTLTIRQTNYSSQHQLLRYHMLNVAFFKADGTYTTQEVLINNSASTTVTYDGSVGVKAILVNEGHQAYVKYVIDNDSLSFFQQNISSITNIDSSRAALARMTIWFYMNEMVRDGRITLLPYRDVILNQLSAQTQDYIYDFQLSFLNEATGSYIPIASRGDSRTSVFDFVMTQLQNNSEKYQKAILAEKQESFKAPWLRMVPQILNPKKIFFKPSIKQGNSPQNRARILQGFLPAFCSTDSQLTDLQSWRKGQYVPLTSYTITQSQAWAVVKLIYASSNYTSTQKTAIYTDQELKTPGILAQLAFNTAIALEADTDGLQNIYSQFKITDESIVVKSSYAQGWNSSVHLNQLVSNFKARIFQDIPSLSKTLSLSHFMFFYTNLAPIDDDLAGTIALYESINLQSADLIGHMNNIQKIIDGYKLRVNLYQVNA